jgi:hypothetical protein
MWVVYKNALLSKPKRLPPLSFKGIAAAEIFIGSVPHISISPLFF